MITSILDGVDKAWLSNALRELGLEQQGDGGDGAGDGNDGDDAMNLPSSATEPADILELPEDQETARLMRSIGINKLQQFDISMRVELVRSSPLGVAIGLRALLR